MEATVLLEVLIEKKLAATVLLWFITEKRNLLT